jgi:hypothetical protein
MDVKELETEVKNLKKLVMDLSRTKDAVDCWKLISTYSHLLHMGRVKDIYQQFAQKTDGIEIEIADSGVYYGLEGVKKVFVELLGDDWEVPGYMNLHMSVNPVIEVNKEGTEARGIFHSPGYITGSFEGKLAAIWEYGRYDITFVKEDGEWKFLKFIWRVTFACPVGLGWVKEQYTASMAVPGYTPDEKSRYHRPYNPAGLNVFPDPEIPKAYDD